MRLSIFTCCGEGKPYSSVGKVIDDYHLEYFHSFIILIQKETLRLLSSLCAVKLMVPSPASSHQFSEHRRCYLLSSPAGRLLLVFHFTPVPPPPVPVRSTPMISPVGHCQTFFFSHTLFLVFFLYLPPSFVRKGEV